MRRREREGQLSVDFFRNEKNKTELIFSEGGGLAAKRDGKLSKRDDNYFLK